jgi:hypothetical protein
LASSTPKPTPSVSSSSSAPADDDKKKKGGLLGGFLSKTKPANKPDEKKDKETAKEPTTPKGSNTSAAVSFTSSAPKAKAGGETAAPAGSTPSTTASVSVAAPSVSVTVKKEESSAGNQEVVALYDYEATEEGELTFAEGERLTLLEQDDSGWWKGKTSKGLVGVFPSNFVELAGAKTEGAAAAAGGSSGGGGGGNAIEINSDYRALYDYDAEDDTELTIKEGDILHVVSETDGWYYGTRKADGKQGNFPSNFVEPV